MKIAVVGAGAMGSIFGARFHQAGHETVLVDVVQPLVDTINADGVTVVRGDDETVTRVPATTDPAAVGPVDIVVFFTKCYHTSSAAEGARPLVGPDTVVASLQNGWGNGDVLAAAYPPGQVVLGVTYNSGLLQGPGRVVHPAEQPTLVGSFSDGGDGADASRGGTRVGGARSDGRFSSTPRDLEEADPQCGIVACFGIDGDDRRRTRHLPRHARPRLGDDARGGCRGAGAGL